MIKYKCSLLGIAHWRSPVFALAAFSVLLKGCGFADPVESRGSGGRGTTDTGCNQYTGIGCEDAGSEDPGSIDTRGCPVGYVRIEPGTFTMGSPTTEDGHNSSETQHSVTITRAYCMKATEVTQGEWQEEMGDNPSSFLSCGSNCPLEQVSWDDAIGYANALSGRAGLQECYTGSTFTGLDCTGYRLPTEAEWEYAARGGTTGPTYGLMDSVGWYTDNSGSRTHPVGGKTANNFGLYDMLGNVWEWTGDWYGTYPGTVTDPTGPTTGSSRVYRGGSWAGPARYARAATRYVAPVSRRSYLGFRLVRTAQ
jgi:formylglycine-generating enzyme required for sulfatase activity